MAKFDTDVSDMARHNNLKPERLQKIKDYMFKNSEMDFVDPEAVEAWERLSKGEGTDIDKLLLKHETAEMYLRKEKGYTQRKAHNRANDKYFWEALAH